MELKKLPTLASLTNHDLRTIVESLARGNYAPNSSYYKMYLVAQELLAWRNAAGVDYQVPQMEQRGTDGEKRTTEAPRSSAEEA